MIIVESHHQVLPHWAKLRASLPEAPILITLDHHTDTSAPFRHHLKNFSPLEQNLMRTKWLAEVDYRNPQTVEKVVEKLDHDEHIVCALQVGIIDSAFVIAQNAFDTPIEVYDQHRILCQTVEERDQILESDFLQNKIKKFRDLLRQRNTGFIESRPYIFDIDLDYINTWQALQPKDSAYLCELARGAALITIATEPEHVRLCAKDQDLSSEALLPKLIALLKI